MDDDDLQHAERIAIPCEHLEEETHLLLKAKTAPLLDAETGLAQEQSRRPFNWYECIFWRETHPLFPPLNLSEDYHMMVAAKNCPHKEKISRKLLSVNLTHAGSTSTAKFSRDPKYWTHPVDPQWINGGGDWTGLSLVPKAPPP
jgi:hypothetical protein